MITICHDEYGKAEAFDTEPVLITGHSFDGNYEWVDTSTTLVLDHADTLSMNYGHWDGRTNNVLCVVYTDEDQLASDILAHNHLGKISTLVNPFAIWQRYKDMTDEYANLLDSNYDIMMNVRLSILDSMNKKLWTADYIKNNPYFKF